MRDHSSLRTPVSVLALRTSTLLIVATLLVTGIVGGLLRAGIAVPVDGAWAGPAVASHAFLMICGFLGTVIGIERAVAVKYRLAFIAPAASALAGLLMLAGQPAAAAGLGLVAALAFVAVNVAVVRRQPADHTALLLVGAAAWGIGNLLHALGARPDAAIPWWFAFLVLTIAAERLEMTRLMRRRRSAATALYGCLGALLLGAALSAPSPRWGGLVYGLALTALAAWLIAFDIARRTIRSQGLSRYMAVCLLLGYAWLAIAGLGWAATALGQPARDLALHALGLGFIFSMMLGHAPVILPALARVKLQFGAFFYLPLVLLHASLVVRLFGGQLGAGALANAGAILAFALTMLGAALVWRLKHPTAPRSHHGHPAPD